MAITLDSTVAGILSNSFTTVEWVDDYFEDHYSSILSSQWVALTDEQKAVALVRACRVLEKGRYTAVRTQATSFSLHRNMTTGGIDSITSQVIPTRYSVEQKLQFPRHIDIDAGGVPFIPEEVMMAQGEQAVYLTTFDESVMAARLQGVTREMVKAGTVSASQEFRGVGSSLSPSAHELMSPFYLRGWASLKRG